MQFNFEWDPAKARDVACDGVLRIRVNGEEVFSVLCEGETAYHVEVSGPLADLSADVSVSVAGDVGNNVHAGGSVNCGDVGNNVAAGGNVACCDVANNLSAGGNVTCCEVMNNASAGGNVTAHSIGNEAAAGGSVRAQDSTE